MRTFWLGLLSILNFLVLQCAPHFGFQAFQYLEFMIRPCLWKLCNRQTLSYFLITTAGDERPKDIYKGLDYVSIFSLLFSCFSRSGLLAIGYLQAPGTSNNSATLFCLHLSNYFCQLALFFSIPQTSFFLLRLMLPLNYFCGLSDHLHVFNLTSGLPIFSLMLSRHLALPLSSVLLTSFFQKCLVYYS